MDSFVLWLPRSFFKFTKPLVLGTIVSDSILFLYSHFVCFADSILEKILPVSNLLGNNFRLETLIKLYGGSPRALLFSKSTAF